MCDSLFLVTRPRQSLPGQLRALDRGRVGLDRLDPDQSTRVFIQPSREDLRRVANNELHREITADTAAAS
ncbi:MAG: hypothetical protein ACT4NL_19085 [Pseudomarimonas sp.]